MTLLITVFAAVVSTAVWYTRPDSKMKTGMLALMYWGAALMWLVDAVVEYFEAGAEFFAPAAADMVNDAFLGASAVALGLVIWLIAVLVKDPNGTIKAALTGKS